MRIIALFTLALGLNACATLNVSDTRTDVGGQKAGTVASAGDTHAETSKTELVGAQVPFWDTHKTLKLMNKRKQIENERLAMQTGSSYVTDDVEVNTLTALGYGPDGVWRPRGDGLNVDEPSSAASKGQASNAPTEKPASASESSSTATCPDDRAPAGDAEKAACEKLKADAEREAQQRTDELANDLKEATERVISEQ